MLLFYIRHGDPIYNPDSLTELGKKQADALVKRMAECNPDKIYVSSSNRAIMTAEPTVRFLGKEPEILDWCNENHAWRELTVTTEDGKRKWCFQDEATCKLLASNEVRQLDRQWYEHPQFANTRFKEGIHRIQRETDQFMLSLGYRHDSERNGYIAERPNDDRIALFAHQGFGLAFLSCLLDVPYPLMTLHFDMGHSGMTVIEFKGDDFVIPKALQVANDSHIFAAGMSTDYQNRVHF